jgi:peptidoglycan/LPS O-acetylase OafA/YrhL
MTQGRLKSVDVLRGCAALAVVTDHAFKHGAFRDINVPWFDALHGIVNHGVLGVPLFFVISGFCIHLPWARMAASGTPPRLDPIGFWRRRIHRLYPPYFVMLCLSITAVVVAWQLGLQIATLAPYPEPRERWIVADFVLHATMLHGFSPAFDQAAGNPPFWTLAREEYLYLMYFAVLSWRGRRGMVEALVAVWIVGVAVPWAASLSIPTLGLSAAWQDRLWHPVNFETSAVALWIQWCLGMAAVEAYFGLLRLPEWCRRMPYVLLWGAAALLAGHQGWQTLIPLLWGMTFFTLINACVEVERSGRWPSTRLLARLQAVGVVSYSIYLIHSPVIGVLNQLERQLLKDSPLLLAPAYHLAVWALLVTAAGTAGWLFFLAVERRFLNYSRNTLSASVPLSALRVSTTSGNRPGIAP